MKQNKVFTYGRHALSEALKHAPHTVTKVYLDNKQVDTKLRGQIDRLGIPVAKLSEGMARSDMKSGAAHQGIIGSISIPQLMVPWQKFISAAPARGAVVLFNGVQDPHNIGAIIRSAAGFGAGAVIIPERGNATVTGAVLKVSAGMAFRIPLVQAASAKQAALELKQKGYHLYSLAGEGARPISKEEFKARKAELQDGCHSTLEENLKKFGEVYSATIWQDLTNTNCENCVGDGLVNSADCYQCFNCFNCQNARYCWMLTPSERCVSAMDITRGGIGELLYNCTGLGGGNYFMRMCSQCRKCSEMTYCIDCYHSKNFFGCAGMKSGNYCILNKQYTEEEYKKLRDRIIAHMKKAGEWGTFFPPSLAPFPYSDSLGQVYFPLSKREAEARGFQWEEPLEQKLKGNTRREPLPDCIADVEDAICHEVLTCETSGKQYKIIRQELEFYRDTRLPLPRKHPDVRMQRRSNMLSAHRLWNRTCAKCGKKIQTSYAPDRPEIVYCEKCYLSEVY